MKKILLLSAFIFLLLVGLSGCVNVEEAVAEMNGQILSKANSFQKLPLTRNGRRIPPGMKKKTCFLW